MNEIMNTNEVKTEFIKRIHDNYTLNLAISMLEDFDKIGLVNNNLLIERMKLEQQLQAYKDKEDKLREYLSNTKFEERTAYDKSFCEGVYNTKEKALKILNEGGK